MSTTELINIQPTQDWSLALGIERRYYAGLKALLTRDAQNVTVTLEGMHSKGGCFSSRRVAFDATSWFLTVWPKGGGDPTTFSMPHDHVLKLRARMSQVSLWQDLHRRWTAGEDMSAYRPEVNDWGSYKTVIFWIGEEGLW